MIEGITRAVSLAFSSHAEKQRMLERKAIIQQAFQTILDYPQPIPDWDPQIRKAAADKELHSDPNVVLRGTEIGWFVFSALYDNHIKGPSTYRPIWDTSHSTGVWAVTSRVAGTYPEFPEDGEKAIRVTLNGVLSREGIHLSGKAKRLLAKKLSWSTVLGFKDIHDTLLMRDHVNNNAYLPLAQLSDLSIQRVKEVLGINPVEFAQQLAPFRQ